MKTKHLKLAGLALLITFLTGTIKISEASYTQPYKSTINGKVTIYIPGQTSGQPSNISSPSIPKAKPVTLNNCGIGRIAKGTTSPVINIEGSGVNFNSATTGAKPTCTLDKTSGAYTSSWNGAIGSILDDGTGYYIKGGTTAGTITVNVTNDAKVNTKANACGTIRVNVSDTKPMATFTLNGTDYSLSSLPEKLPEQCKASVKYLPISESVSSGG